MSKVIAASAPGLKPQLDTMKGLSMSYWVTPQGYVGANGHG